MNTIISQATATGLPVVTTNHSGLPEQVLEGKNGAVVPEGDYRALAEAILYLMAHTEVWPEYGRYGRAHAAAHYDSGKLIHKQVEYYEEVVSQKRVLAREHLS